MSFIVENKEKIALWLMVLNKIWEVLSSLII